ncbi:MAG TPA: alpha/beta fold hydrolase [Thermoanaerobaculia bacterium]|nr:alpha/beta fold hydrolase [Thermoanaerobaculia bacterium]
MTGPVNGPAGQLYVDDGGAGGLPVVFVHSYAGSGAHWAAQLAHLRPTRQAVAFDFGGHGRSEAPAAGDYAVESLAADIAAVVDALGLGRFVLVGHSMGGAAAHPGDLRLRPDARLEGVPGAQAGGHLTRLVAGRAAQPRA